MLAMAGGMNLHSYTRRTSRSEFTWAARTGQFPPNLEQTEKLFQTLIDFFVKVIISNLFLLLGFS